MRAAITAKYQVMDLYPVSARTAWPTTRAVISEHDRPANRAGNRFESRSPFDAAVISRSFVSDRCAATQPFIRSL